MKNIISCFVLISNFAIFGQISANGSQIKDLAEPTDAQDAVTKAYVETLEQEIEYLKSIFVQSGQINPDIEWSTLIQAGEHFIRPTLIKDSLGGFTLVVTGKVSDVQGYDIVVIRLDENGKELWRNNYGSLGSDQSYGGIIQKSDESGYVVVGSVSEASLNVSTLIGGGGNNDIWIFEINNYGELINEKTFGGSGNDKAKKILLSDDGFLILAETFSSDGNINGYNCCESDIWLFEIDNNLNFLSGKTFGNDNYDYAEDIIEMSPDNYILGGTVSMAGGDVSTSLGSLDIWIANISWPSGQINWDKTLGSPDGNDSLGALKKVNDDFFVFSGNQYDGQSNKGFFGKMSKLGGVLSNETIFGNDYGQTSFLDISIDSEENYYFLGEFSSYGGDVKSQTFGENDILLLKTDNNFNEIWQKSFGGSGNEPRQREFLNMVFDSKGLPVICTGTSSNDGSVASFSTKYKLWIFSAGNSN